VREIAEFALMQASTALFPPRLSARRLDAAVDERCDFMAAAWRARAEWEPLSFAFLRRRKSGRLAHRRQCLREQTLMRLIHRYSN
jgi:hypothetical protein